MYRPRRGGRLSWPRHHHSLRKTATWRLSQLLAAQAITPHRQLEHREASNSRPFWSQATTLTTESPSHHESTYDKRATYWRAAKLRNKSATNRSSVIRTWTRSGPIENYSVKCYNAVMLVVHVVARKLHIHVNLPQDGIAVAHIQDPNWIPLLFDLWISTLRHRTTRAIMCSRWKLHSGT